jgi:hypothetical protein
MGGTLTTVPQLKNEEEPTVEVNDETMEKECLEDNDVTLLDSVAISEVKLAYYLLKKIATTVNDVDEFFSSLKQELTEGKLSAHHIPQLMEELIKLEGCNIYLDKSTVEFVLEALLNTCNERLFQNKTIALQNELIPILEKGLVGDEHQVYGNENIPDVVLAYHFLKQVPAGNDADEFFSSLKQELTEGKLSASNITSLINELNQIEGQGSKRINQDVEALKVDVDFVLQALLNTCEERSCMKDIINNQNEVVLDLISQDTTAYDELTSISGQTGTDGAAGSEAGQTSCAVGSHPAQPSLDVSEEKNGLSRILTRFEKAFGLVRWIIIENETAFLLSVILTKRQPNFTNLAFRTALSNAGPLSVSQFSLETQKSKKFWIDRHSMGAYVTCIKHNDSLQKWGPEFVRKGETHVVDGLPTEAQNKFYIDNRTHYVLHVTIHEENREVGFVPPAMTEDFGIEEGSVRVSIKNNNDQSWGWCKNKKIINGQTLTITGEPLLFK